MKRQWLLTLGEPNDYENYVFEFRRRESELAIALDAVRAPICRPGIEAAPDDEWSVIGWRAEGENLPHSFERLRLKVLGTKHEICFRPHVADYDLKQCLSERHTPDGDDAQSLLAKDVSFSLFGYMPSLPSGEDRNQTIWLYGCEVDPHVLVFEDGGLQWKPLFEVKHRRKRKPPTYSGRARS